MPAWLHLKKGRISATLAMFPAGHVLPAVQGQSLPQRKSRVKYGLQIAGCTNPWADTMRPYMQRMLGSDALGAKTLELLTAAWAETTADTYASCIRKYFQFCDEQRIPPLSGNVATMARYVTWIGEQGTIKAKGLQPYLTAVNNFYSDHGMEPVALGQFLGKVQAGLKASQVELDPEPIRLALPARVVRKALDLAHTLRSELGPVWSKDPGTRPRIELFRASLAVVTLFLFYCRGGAGVECLSGDLVVSSEGGILLYHRTRKGQRGAAAQDKLLCQLPASAPGGIADLLQYFDAARTRYANGKLPVARWAIGHREGHTKWTADTLTAWLRTVLTAVQEQPPPGFAWTSHSLRKGAATSSYIIGVQMQIIKFYGGWTRESDVVLQYIDPTVLPCPAAWYFFGWLTPWGGQPAVVPRQTAT